MTWELKQTAQRILADETGTIYKPHGARLRVALAFPNTYRLGMSNLGFQTVYRLFNEIPDVVCERVFLPEPEQIHEFQRTRTHLFSLESQMPLRDFDVVAFSMTFEPDSLHVLSILDLAGIHLNANERGDDEPLIIAGGPAATINPEPLSQFVDAFAIGEAEEMAAELTARMATDLNQSRSERIRSLASVPSIYVPSLYQAQYNSDGTIAGFTHEQGVPDRITKRVAQPLDDFDATAVIATPNTEFGDVLLTEVARGCKRGCRFCVAGYAYRPARFRGTEAVTRATAFLDTEEGYPHRVGLVGSSVSDNPRVEEICRSLISRGLQVTASSLRADSLGADLADELAKGGQLTATIAPEAGTDRLRKVIRKPIPEEEFFRVVHDLVQAGIKKIKLYFMLGLPTETDEDVDGLIDLSLRLWKGSGLQKLTIGATPFVPKPFTPFQWHAMEDRKVLEKRVDRIRSAIRRVKHVEMSFESPRESLSQAVLARGDRRIGPAILACHQNGGNWLKAFKETGVDVNFYATQLRSEAEIHPWEIVDLKLSREMLWGEYQMALAESI
jgi:radical SAM superfamily enzyme YgiQ (UPF0313 family)